MSAKRRQLSTAHENFVQWAKSIYCHFIWWDQPKTNEQKMNRAKNGESWVCRRDDGVHSATWRLLTDENSIEFAVVQELRKLFSLAQTSHSHWLDMKHRISNMNSGCRTSNEKKLSGSFFVFFHSFSSLIIARTINGTNCCTMHDVRA